MKLLRIVTVLLIVAFLALVSGVLLSFTTTTKPTLTLNVVYDTAAFSKSTDTVLHKPVIALQWNDFVAKAKADATTVANSAVGYKFDAGILSKDKNVTVTISISAFFIRSKSWGKNEHRTPYILTHEQRHFDLARYGAELFRRELLKQNMTTKNVAQCLQNAYKTSWDAYLQLQAQYDSETNHSINKAQQALWDKKIEALLLACK